jgi:hypothetical protein
VERFAGGAAVVAWIIETRCDICSGRLSAPELARGAYVAALLGDLEARRGKLRAARRNYRRSLQLNPRNPFVRDLAKDARSAIRQSG